MERELQTFPNLFTGMASREEDTGIALREKVGLLKAALGGCRHCPFQGIVLRHCGCLPAFYSTILIPLGQRLQSTPPSTMTASLFWDPVVWALV